MKPFFLLLLLIASGILVAILARLLTQFTEAVLSPGRLPKRLKSKRQETSVASPTTGPAGNSRKPSLPGKRWQPAAQF